MRRLNENVPFRRAVLAAAVSAVLSFGLLVIWATSTGGTMLSEIVVAVSIDFLVVFASLLAAGRRGLLLLWVLLLLFWIFSLYAVLDSAYWVLAAAVTLLPVRFAFWSALALPLFAASGVFLRGGRVWPLTVRTLAVSAAWFSLILVSAYLGGFAPDVQMSFRDHPIIILVIGMIMPSTPVLLCWLALRQVRHDNSGRAGVHLSGTRDKRLAHRPEP